MPVTTSQSFPGLLKPSYSRPLRSPHFERTTPDRVHKQLAIEDLKVKARKRGQLRALTRR